ncbi:glycine zipper 2TM domain-containing protein [Vibrio salinus]|uniref:glycine zipper 2TM domain-containing protein n=1 Tax=Vibrio salinus TaxID=2899784 RepID=UPI001E3D098A|nr:glycine zipper 2TM domain-containing protein [Vibrio salinus]MCE0496267.1 glycine zipper 2TM domain-containing protein [Vibrio salinus]
MRWVVLILSFLPFFANAGYQRNVARPVDKVVFGTVDSVRYFNSTEIEYAKNNGLKTFLGAVAGGVIGHQFGGGRGKGLATIVGTVAGAAVTNHYVSQPYEMHDEGVDLLIRTKDGQLIDVIQDVDRQMIFLRNDKVRILYFKDGVRVDKDY